MTLFESDDHLLQRNLQLDNFVVTTLGSRHYIQCVVQREIYTHIHA